MFTAITSALLAVTLIAARPTARVVERIDKAVKAAKREKAMRKEAMDRYLEREIMDIEH